MYTYHRDSELTEDSDEEMEVELSASSGPLKAPKHDLMLEEGKAKSIFFKQAKSFPMFPCREERPRWDEYGEPIRWGCVGDRGTCVWVSSYILLSNSIALFCVFKVLLLHVCSIHTSAYTLQTGRLQAEGRVGTCWTGELLRSSILKVWYIYVNSTSA